MPLYAFQQIYSNFCFKYGFKEVPSIEQETEALEAFSITIDNLEGKLEPAFIHVRLKSPKEKAGESEK